MRRGFTRVPHWLAERPGLSATEKMVFVLIASHANHENESWPSQESLAKRLEVSERTIQRAVQALRDAGLISASRGKGSRGVRNTYTIMIDLSGQQVPVSHLAEGEELTAEQGLGQGFEPDTSVGLNTTPVSGCKQERKQQSRRSEAGYPAVEITQVEPLELEPASPPLLPAVEGSSMPADPACPTSAFERLLSNYVGPVKNVRACRGAFEQAASETDAHLIVDAAQRWAEHYREQQVAGYFVPDLLRWLREETYLGRPPMTGIERLREQMARAQWETPW